MDVGKEQGAAELQRWRQRAVAGYLGSLGPDAQHAIQLWKTKLAPALLGYPTGAIQEANTRMRLFPPPLMIGDTEGFTKEKDLFDRADIGRGLANIIDATEDPLVIAVDGQWGTGKTVFLKMWAGELRNRGIAVVFFDAFENDFATDPFTAIAGKLVDLAREMQKLSTKAGQDFVKTAVRTGKVLLRSSLKLGVKAVTVGVVNADDLQSMGDSIADELSEVADKHLGELITKAAKDRGAIEAFRQALANLPALLSERAGEEKPRLVVIIDELDRCKPLFALALLERIKHFYSVPNVHFVLGVHLGQLSSSVRVAYGPDIDAQVYLQKFIHLTMPLADVADRYGNSPSKRFVEYLTKALDFPPDAARAVELSAETILRVAKHRNLSLRTIERIFAQLAAGFAYSSEKVRVAPLLAGLCILKIIEPDLYLNAKQGRLAFDGVMDALGFLETKADDHDAKWAIGWWRYALDPAASAEVIREYGRMLGWHHNLSNRFELVPYFANNVVDRFIPRS